MEESCIQIEEESKLLVECIRRSMEARDRIPMGNDGLPKILYPFRNPQWKVALNKDYLLTKTTLCEVALKIEKVDEMTDWSINTIFIIYIRSSWWRQTIYIIFRPKKKRCRLYRKNFKKKKSISTKKV